jgi:hypothetical protein
VLPLRAEDPPDLAEQRVDVVADPALAELAERDEIRSLPIFFAWVRTWR